MLETPLASLPLEQLRPPKQVLVEIMEQLRSGRIAPQIGGG